MIKNFFLFFLFFACIAFKSSDYTLIKTINYQASYITTDNLGNLYTLSGNELKKYDSNGNLLKTFSDKTHGNISFVDVSNPLKILLYYHDFRLILFLDNMLSICGDALSIDNMNIIQGTLVCNSYENGLWIYDQQDFQLIRFDKNRKMSNQSGNIAQLTGVEIKPVYMFESGNMVYLNDTANGIFVFDKYGTYSKTLPFKNINNFQIINDNIIYMSGTKLIKYNLKTLEQTTINLPKDNASLALIEKDRLFISDAFSVYIYSVK
ncbi:MAG: hypothetical protein HGB12_09115 [Bacteroidetes bacterium]|nr:hypothetical protein [Bacteroidota bacterium]